MLSCLVSVCCLVLVFSLLMSSSRLLNCLIVMENLNVLLLFVCLISQVSEFRVLFLVLIVIFTIEITLGLVVLTRLWSFSTLIDIVGL